MPRIVGIELCELDLPFRHAFRHAAAERVRSESLLLRFVTDGGHVGYGEALPRAYVTGETRGAAFDLLAQRILPRLLGSSFVSFGDVCDFLADCDGKAPPAWIDGRIPQTAAWCAVDLALLDTFGRAFGVHLGRGLPGGNGAGTWPEGLRYSLVLSDDPGRRRLATLLKARLYGIHDVKIKVSGQSPAGVRLARRVLGSRAHLRVDANMAWSYGGAQRAMALAGSQGVEAVEQPLPADDLEGMARLTADGVPVMADESIHDAASLETLIAARACAGVNVRIAKCGGLVASLARSRRALEAGLTLQVGCQVGETALLSAAQLALVRTVGEGISYLEGCFGERLLAVDPVQPVLEFGRGGRPPTAPDGPGFGTEVDWHAIDLYGGRRISLGATTSDHAEDLR
jgi:L-alanine-DL-glutamate epimerase-like enolase superfamily enzyme